MQPDSSTGTPPLTRFFGPGKNRVKGKPRYRRSILVLKPQNGEFFITLVTVIVILLLKCFFCFMKGLNAMTVIAVLH